MTLMDLVMSVLSCAGGKAAMAPTPSPDGWEGLIMFLNPITTGLLTINVFLLVKTVFLVALATVLYTALNGLFRRAPKLTLARCLKADKTKTGGSERPASQAKSLSDLDFLKKRFVSTIMSLASARKDPGEGAKLFDVILNEIDKAKKEYLTLGNADKEQAKAA